MHSVSSQLPRPLRGRSFTPQGSACVCCGSGWGRAAPGAVFLPSGGPHRPAPRALGQGNSHSWFRVEGWCFPSERSPCALGLAGGSSRSTFFACFCGLHGCPWDMNYTIPGATGCWSSSDTDLHISASSRACQRSSPCPSPSPEELGRELVLELPLPQESSLRLPAP